MDESVTASDAEPVRPVLVDERVVVYVSTPGDHPSSTYVISSDS